jgi:hypothetical protein
MDEREDRIRQRAYGIWEREGRPEGRDRDHWQEAERGDRPDGGGFGGDDGDGSLPEEPAGIQHGDLPPAGRVERASEEVDRTDQAGDVERPEGYGADVNATAGTMGEGARSGSSVEAPEDDRERDAGLGARTEGA